MRRRHLLLRKHVTCALVLSNLIDVGIDAQLVERAAEKHYVSRKAVDEKLSRRRDVNLVAGGGDVVVLVHAIFELGINRFARRAKILNRATNLFSLGPTRSRFVDVQQHGRDALVGFRFSELRQQIAQRLWLAAKDESERIV